MHSLLKADEGVFSEICDATFKAIKEHLKVYVLLNDEDLYFALRQSLNLVKKSIESRWFFRDKARYKKKLHLSAITRLQNLLERLISESEKPAEPERPRGRTVCAKPARR